MVITNIQRWDLCKDMRSEVAYQKIIDCSFEVMLSMEIANAAIFFDSGPQVRQHFADILLFVLEFDWVWGEGRPVQE